MTYFLILWVYMDYVIDKIKSEILEAVKLAIAIDVDVNKLEIERPPEKNMGDFALPCFYLTKLLRISPNQIAQELKNKIRPGKYIKSVQNIGPYLNFFIDTEFLAQKVISEIEKKGIKYGSHEAKNIKVMLEYSGPNTHKEFHIGHLRNNVLGVSLVNLIKFSGKKVISVNYVGDIGAHVAKCLWAYNKFHKNEAVPEKKGKYLGTIYAEAVRRIDEDETLAKDVSEVQQKLESGDKYWIKIWKQTRQWSLDELNDIYKIIGANFDKIFYESEVEQLGKKIVKELLEKGIAEKSEGAVIIDLEKYNLKKFLLLKSDGSSLYSTKELALAKLKFEKYKVDESYMVIDTRQSFYLQQFFKTLQIIGFDKKITHIPYEFVTLKDGAMASRKGNIVSFEDFLNEVILTIAEETKKRHQDWSDDDINSIAKKIALGAIKFYMLRVGNNNIITFDLEEAKSYDGFTGPYLQYTVSRINSILNKSNFKTNKKVDFSLLTDSLEKELLIGLARFPEVILEVAEELDPSGLAKYLFDLAKNFSSYYQIIPILTLSEDLKISRLALIKSIRQVLVNGLGLLGVEVPEKM